MEELIQRIHPDDQPAFRESANRAEHRKLDEEIDYRIVHPGGAVREIHSIGHPVFSPHGDLIKYTGTVIDITERKRAEEDLRASERKYRHLVDTTPAFIHTALSDGSLDFLSRGWLEYGGLPQTSLLDWRWTGAIHPEDVERFADKWRTALASGEPFEAESRVRRADGEYRWFLQRNVPLRDESGNIVKWYGTGIDIEERKVAEESLRSSEAYLAEAQRLSQTGSWAWSPDQDIKYWSEECYRVLSFDPRDGLPRFEEFFQRIHPDDQPGFTEVIQTAIREKAEWETDYRIVHPDGRVRDIHVVGHSVLGTSGHLVEFVGTVIDVTDRKRAEQELRTSELERARIEHALRRSQKMEAIGTFAGGIAHDFNNILGAILGFSELAQGRLCEGKALDDELEQVMHASKRGERLVEHILAFSRSSVGSRVPVHVESVVVETLAMLVASLPPGVRLEQNLSAGDAAVVGDATQLHQVAMNLCTNAVQAMARGGVLTVTLDRMELAQQCPLSHGVLEPGVYVRLSVSDTGSGIPGTALERIFDPFFTTKGVGKGTGLGLSLVHGIVAESRGAIDVVTREGAGTTFTVWLPCSGETGAPAVEDFAELPQGHGESVMVVDDEQLLVRLAEETLAQLGYDPAGFDSSVAALEAFRAEPQRYDLLLTDQTMPDLTGTELAQAVRQLRPELPIVLMSGYKGSQLNALAQAAGVCEILHKPLVSRDIAESIARALPRT
jgi:PAS domain S-box-containing protein